MKTETYPAIGFLRLRDVIGDKDNPGITPVSRSSWYKGIAEGRYPKSVKLGERASAWGAEDIRGLIDQLSRDFLKSTILRTHRARRC